MVASERNDGRERLKEWLQRGRNVMELDYHYTVLRRDLQHRWVMLEFVRKSLSILVVSLNRFVKDACNVSASALTFYSVLSFIPIVALAFGIARGFNVDEVLRTELQGQLANSPELANRILGFAEQAIANTKRGWVTGVGIVLLLWTILKVLNSTELAMNRIWGIREGRGLRRMFTDYISVIFIAPILIVVVSSLNVYLTSDLKESFPVAATFVARLLKFLPYLLVWMLFIFLYMFMPAIPVKFRHAFFAGMIAGTVYQVVQWFYIQFQVGVSSYNAIYGSLAAFPLLLVWLQVSWSIVLWGVELCYICRNRHFMYRSELYGDEGWLETIECAIRIMRYVAREYINGKGGPSQTMVNKAIAINSGKLRLVLEELVDHHLLVVVKKQEDYFYYPAADVYQLSVADVVIALSRVRESKNEAWRNQFEAAIQTGFSKDKLV